MALISSGASGFERYFLFIDFDFFDGSICEKGVQLVSSQRKKQFGGVAVLGHTNGNHPISIGS